MKYYIEQSDYYEDIHQIKLRNYPGVCVAVISACGRWETDLKDIIKVIEQIPNKPLKIDGLKKRKV